MVFRSLGLPDHFCRTSFAGNDRSVRFGKEGEHTFSAIPILWQSLAWRKVENSISPEAKELRILTWEETRKIAERFSSLKSVRPESGKRFNSESCGRKFC